MLAALALALLAQCGPEGPVFSCPSLTSSVSYALLEFAPADGAGMGAACACTTPTGAKGEALTFTRASTAFCTKGNETSGIVNGDLVECASEQPRVMPGGDGTGGLGLSVWEARTNSALRSEEFDNAAWIKSGTISAAPVVTANQATAPDGTLTADRVQFADCATATAASVVYQDTAVSNARPSVYAKGVSGGGTFSVCMYNLPAAACVVCTFNSSTWTRCVGAAAYSTGSYIVLGCQNNPATYPGAANTGAADVYLWGAQHEAGTTVSPPIKTAGTAATRVAETATFASAAWPFATSSSSGTVTRAVSGAGFGAISLINPDGNHYSGVDAIGGAARCSWRTTGGITTASAGSPSAASYRLACSATPAGLTAWLDGVAGTPVAIVSPLEDTITAPLKLGGHSATSFVINGVVKQFCFDSSSTRCR